MGRLAVGLKLNRAVSRVEAVNVRHTQRCSTTGAAAADVPVATVRASVVLGWSTSARLSTMVAGGLRAFRDVDRPGDGGTVWEAGLVRYADVVAQPREGRRVGARVRRGVDHDQLGPVPYEGVDECLYPAARHSEVGRILLAVGAPEVVPLRRRGRGSRSGPERPGPRGRVQGSSFGCRPSATDS